LPRAQETYRLPRAERWSSERCYLRKVGLLFSMCEIVKLKLKESKFFYIYIMFIWVKTK
jgi:hypothetical protein